LAFAASALGCAAYEVRESDRDNFALAKVQASQLMSAVEGEKPAARNDPALAESLRLARAKEGTLAELLAKKNLNADEVRALRATVAAYRERLTDLAKAAGPEDSATQVEKNLARIEQNLAGYLASHEQEFRQNFQTSLHLISETLAVVDQVTNHDPDGAPARREAFEQQLRTSIASLGDALDALDQPALLAWFEEVDASLKAGAATGTVPPGLLKADRLADALATSMGAAALGDGNEPVGEGLTIALGFLEEMVAGARTFGVEPRDALVILSEEFSKIVARYEGLHPAAARVTVGSGAP
jgi:hypothetical protein